MKPSDFFHSPSVPLADAGDLPDKQGLYAAISGRNILYIGASADIRKRWSAHEKTIQLLKFPDVRIAYRLWSRYSLWAVESDLIELALPRLNRTARSRGAVSVPVPVPVKPPRPVKVKPSRKLLTQDEYQKIEALAESSWASIWSTVTLYPSRGTKRYRFCWGVGGRTVQTADIKGGDASNPVVLRRVETVRRWVERGEPLWRVVELLREFPEGQRGRPRKHF
jgi:hypothetical protein